MRRLVMFTAIALVVGACTRVGASDAPPSDTSTPPSGVAELAASTPTETVSPTLEPLPSDLEPDIRQAIEMRRGLGLRFDLAYVLATESDPRANSQVFDFRMYPEEEAKVFADQAAQRTIGEAIKAYATKHREEFGGYYIDREDMPGVVVALWTDHLESHEAAIRSTIGEIAPFAVRQVNYSEAELRAIQDRVTADWRASWVATIPAVIQGVGVETIENVVVVEISSANPNAAAIIESHYDLGNRLRVESDGTGAALAPWGRITGVVTRADGTSLGESAEDLILDWGDTRDDIGSCGGGDIGYGVDGRGRFDVPCQIGRRTIFVKRFIADGEWLTIGQGVTRVREGLTSKLWIRLTEDP
jgi:hypothetical protein